MAAMNSLHAGSASVKGITRSHFAGRGCAAMGREAPRSGRGAVDDRRLPAGGRVGAIRCRAGVCTTRRRSGSVCRTLARGRPRAGGRRGRSSRSCIAEQAILRLPIEIGGRPQTVLPLVLCETSPGLWPEHAVDFPMVKVIGLELLLNVADFGTRHLARARMPRRMMAPGICLGGSGKGPTGA